MKTSLIPATFVQFLEYDMAFFFSIMNVGAAHYESVQLFKTPSFTSRYILFSKVS
jgi:hypothetical protein